MRAFIRSVSIMVLGVLITPAAASAQGSIAGQVKDASGAVLPGVTVEASSPVLIEKGRTAVTDGTGQYRIVDLNSDTVLALNNNFGAWQRPTSILTARFAKISAQFDF